MESHYVEAQGPSLSTEVSFVRIDPGDWKLPQDNQRVSSLVYQRLPIIIVVGLHLFNLPLWFTFVAFDPLEVFLAETAPVFFASRSLGPERIALAGFALRVVKVTRGAVVTGPPSVPGVARALAGAGVAHLRKRS